MNEGKIIGVEVKKFVQDDPRLHTSPDEVSRAFGFDHDRSMRIALIVRKRMHEAHGDMPKILLALKDDLPDPSDLIVATYTIARSFHYKIVDMQAEKYAEDILNAGIEIGRDMEKGTGPFKPGDQDPARAPGPEQERMYV